MARDPARELDGRRMPRRDFLKALAAAGAGPLLGSVLARTSARFRVVDGGTSIEGLRVPDDEAGG